MNRRQREPPDRSCHPTPSSLAPRPSCRSLSPQPSSPPPTLGLKPAIPPPATSVPRATLRERACGPAACLCPCVFNDSSFRFRDERSFTDGQPRRALRREPERGRAEWRKKERKRGREGETEKRRGRKGEWLLSAAAKPTICRISLSRSGPFALAFCRQRFAYEVANRRGRLRTFLYAAIDLILKNADMVKISQSFYRYSGYSRESD